MLSATAVAATLLALADGCARRANRYEEKKLQNDGAEDARYCWLFLNTYTETYTLSHLLEIKPIKQRLFRYTQTT